MFCYGTKLCYLETVWTFQIFVYKFFLGETKAMLSPELNYSHYENKALLCILPNVPWIFRFFSVVDRVITIPIPLVLLMTLSSRLGNFPHMQAHPDYYTVQYSRETLHRFPEFFICSVFFSLVLCLETLGALVSMDS